MKKILYITPHLSTGGLPQYLVKKIELLKDIYDINVIEYDDITGGKLIIQKNRLINLIGDKLKTISRGEDKKNVLKFINKIKPHVIHFEEMPEYFMDDSITKKIYNPQRTYNIFETCHDSSFNVNNKRFKPDKFILVSQYQVEMLAPLNVPSEVVEYPIEHKERPNRVEALINLGLDPEYKHILHVGLFTPRKNQVEFFEYAKKFENQKVIFHSVGNMADNFKFYWGPLLSNKPSNVVIHGEKDNVDDYYAAMDLFLFTSKGTINDKETMPLVIREAISWGIPTLIYNLPVYQNYFDEYASVHYLNFNEQDKNIDLISEMLGFDKDESDKTAIIISTYPISKNIIDLTEKSINEIKKQGYDVILVSHAKVPESLQNVNYVVYDSNNLLTHHDFYSTSWFESDEYKVTINLKSEGNNIYHGPAVYTNYYNGINLAKNLGYKNAICFNFDMVIKDKNVISNLINQLKGNKAIYNLTKPQEGNSLRTVLFATQIDYFLKHFKLITNEKEYNEWKVNIGSESNGLENMFYHTLKDNLNDLKLLTDDEFYSMLSNCEIDLCSRVEYFSVLPINDKQFAVWFSTNNLIDDREFKLFCYKDNLLIDLIDVETKTKQRFYKVFEYTGGEYKFNLYEGFAFIKSIIVDKDYMNNKIKNNGNFLMKK